MEISEGTGSPAPHPPEDSSLMERAARGEALDSGSPVTLRDGCSWSADLQHDKATAPNSVTTREELGLLTLSMGERSQGLSPQDEQAGS